MATVATVIVCSIRWSGDLPSTAKALGKEDVRLVWRSESVSLDLCHMLLLGHTADRIGSPVTALLHTSHWTLTDYERVKARCRRVQITCHGLPVCLLLGFAAAASAAQHGSTRIACESSVHRTTQRLSSSNKGCQVVECLCVAKGARLGIASSSRPLASEQSTA